jgi:ferrous iron transport protein B
VVFIGALFAKNAGTVLWSLYLLGIVLSIIMGIIFRKTFFKGEAPMFILELPPYRIPTMQNTLIHTWEKVKHYLKKASTVILAASILIWFLLNIPFGVIDQKDSLLGKTGQALSVVFKPLGFGTWEASASLITGIMAKEIVVGTMGEIYAGKKDKKEGPTPAFTQDLKEIGTTFVSAAENAFTNVFSTFKISSLKTDTETDERGIRSHIIKTFTPLSAYAFMVFVLLYMPCLVTAAAFRQEFGTWYWFGVAVAYELVLAYGLAFTIYQGGKLLGIGV